MGRRYLPSRKPGERRGYTEPRRVSPRLAVYVREGPDPSRSAGSWRVRSSAVQLRACRRKVVVIRGRHEELDVFVDVDGADAPYWDVLLRAIAAGLYDGVVIDSLPVAVTDVVQSIELRRLMRWSGCELYVADDPSLGLWDTQGLAFSSAVERLCSSMVPGGSPVGGGLPCGSSHVASVGVSQGLSGFAEADVVGADDLVERVGALVARFGRVMDLFLDAVDDPRRSVVLRLRVARIELELRRLRLLSLRRAVGVEV